MENNQSIDDKNNQNLSFIPDFELRFSKDELESLEMQLTQEEQQVFQEILELEKQVNGKTDFMKELLEAAKKGTMQYLDAMTDTGDTFSDMKRPESVKQWDDTQIKPLNPSAFPGDGAMNEPRTMSDANRSAFRKECNTDGMSESGKILFDKYEKSYSQRTKSLNKLSTDESSINRSDQSVNFDTLSGLRGYRIGPVVQMPTAAQAKEDYEEYVNKNPGTSKTASVWLYNKNMDQFDDELAKQLGFSSRSQARKWRSDNSLTVHEGPDGMFMVPNDVHNSAKHNGYRSMMSKYVEGKVSSQDVDNFIRNEKIAYIKHESITRGTRMVKGIGLSAVKDLLKCTIVVMSEETYNEFKVESQDKFIDRMLNVFKKAWEKVKAKFASILKNLLKNIKGSILSELLTALNDFFFGTFKNIFKIVRQMWTSIKNAFKIIFSKDDNISIGERFFEASKILTAGIVGVLGFSLNELIEKGLTSIGIPFASFISECLSGLFAGIMSAIVMMLFDKFKKDFLTDSPLVKKMQLESKNLYISCAQVSLSSLKLDIHVVETYNFIGNVFLSISDKIDDINNQNIKSTYHTTELIEEAKKQDEQNQYLSGMKRKYANDDNF